MVSDKHIRARWKDVVSPCPYLKDRNAIMEYAVVERLTSAEYSEWLDGNWRKMGPVLFRPQCVTCWACESIRVLALQFQPRRIHKRVMRANADLQMRISPFEVTLDHIKLVDRYEHYRQETVGWSKGGSNALQVLQGLVSSPLPVLQLALYDGDKLVAFCVVDQLPDGFSAVNSFWAPELENRSLGVYVILSLIEEAKRRNFPYVYLGYFVAGCRSMKYKGNYHPAEVLTAQGWQPFSPPQT